MLAVEIDPKAVEDIELIAESDPLAAAKILATIEQMGADPDLQDSMLEKDSNHGDLNFKPFWELYNRRKNIWRMRDFGIKSDMRQYRLLYAFVPHGQPTPARFCILAVINRGDFNYEPTHQITRRLIQSHSELY